MYRVNRLNIVSEIEQLLSDLFVKAELKKCSEAAYDELLDCTISVLNDSSNEKIYDRVDKEFSLREVPHQMHLCIFEYFADFIEKVRRHEIDERVPRYVKYKATRNPSKGLSVTDYIEIDYTLTFLHCFKETVNHDYDIVDNPDPEQMNRFLGKIDNERPDKN